MSNKTDIQKLEEAYFKYLFELKTKIVQEPILKQDKNWIDTYEKVKGEENSQNKLAIMLALIHPDFYYKDGSYFGDNLPWKRSSTFSSDITNQDRCQSHRYNNIPCVFNSMPNLRGKCQADHIWPNSLGGPSILDNRLILCRFHNGMKSNSIYLFDWITPVWLENYLDKIYRLKL